MKKLIVIAIVVLSIAVMFAGCTKNVEQPSTPPTEQQNSGAANGTSEPTAKIADNAKDAQGKFIGWIDNNSVEIEMSPEDVAAFRVPEGLDQIKGIEDGSMVKFSYTANENGQLVIGTIEKLQ